MADGWGSDSYTHGLLPAKSQNFVKNRSGPCFSVQSFQILHLNQ
jgi:hypothetical protein